MIKYIALVMVGFTMTLMCGCRGVERVYHTTTTDSIVIERREVDTLVVIGADSSLLTSLWECDSLGNILMTEIETLQGERSHINTQVQYVNVVDSSGVVRRKAYMSIVAVADSLRQRVRILEEYISHQHQEAVAKERKKYFPIAPYVVALMSVMALLIVLLTKKAKS